MPELTRASSPADSAGQRFAPMDGNVTSPALLQGETDSACRAFECIPVQTAANGCLTPFLFEKTKITGICLAQTSRTHREFNPQGILSLKKA